MFKLVISFFCHKSDFDFIFNFTTHQDISHVLSSATGEFVFFFC